MRAAVEVGTTSDPAWAGSLSDYRAVSAAFLESLKGISVFDTLLPSMRRVPLRTRITAVTLAAAGAVPGENRPKPISRLTLADNGILTPVQATAVVVLSNDLIKLSGAAGMALVSSELRGAVAASSDRVFLSALMAAATAVPSTGSTPAAILADLAGLLAAVNTVGNARLYLVLHPTDANRLATLPGSDGRPAFATMGPTGGIVQGIPALVSDQQPAGTVLLLDATGIAAESEVVTVDVFGHANVQLDDDPDDPATEATPMVNLWQRDMSAIEARRWLGFEVVRPAVATLTGLTWS